MTSKEMPLKNILEGKKFHRASPTDSIRAVAMQMPKTHSSAVAVIENNKFIGLLTERDIVERVIGQNLNVDKTKARDVLTNNPVTIDINTSLSEALRIITDNYFRVLPVMEGNKFVGILDIRDLYEGMNLLLKNQHELDKSLINYCFGEAYGAG